MLWDNTVNLLIPCAAAILPLFWPGHKKAMSTDVTSGEVDHRRESAKSRTRGIMKHPRAKLTKFHPVSNFYTETNPTSVTVFIVRRGHAVISRARMRRLHAEERPDPALQDTACKCSQTKERSANARPSSLLPAGSIPPEAHNPSGGDSILGTLSSCGNTISIKHRCLVSQT